MPEEGKRPDFVGDGISVWVETVKNGEHAGDKYLSIRLLGMFGIKICAFKNYPKPQQEIQIEQPPQITYEQAMQQEDPLAQPRQLYSRR